MNILLNPIGSRGDIQPLVALGQYLHQRGHNVRVAGSPNGADMATHHGLEFYAIGFDIQQALEERKTDVASPIRVYQLFTDLLKQIIQEQFAELPPHIEWADVVLAGGIVLATYSLCEAHGKPFRYVAYCPQVIPSGDHPMLFLPFVRLPKLINRFSWWIGVRLLRSGLKEHFLPARDELGLPSNNQFENYIIPPGHILYAIDERVVPLPQDLQPAVSTGYFYLPQPQPLPATLLSFLEAGEPPLYIGFGSMTDECAARTTNIILSAAQAAGVRVVISRGWAGLGTEDLPPFAHVIDAISHESLFPKMAGIVHHGGAGTTAAAARSGRPQAIIPHLLDQFYWAGRIERLQVGPKGFWKNRLTTQKLTKLFKGFAAENYETNAKKLGKDLQQRDGLREAAKHVEALLDPSHS